MELGARNSEHDQSETVQTSPKRSGALYRLVWMLSEQGGDDERRPYFPLLNLFIVYKEMLFEGRMNEMLKRRNKS